MPVWLLETESGLKPGALPRGAGLARAPGPAALTWLALGDAGRQQGNAQAEAGGDDQQAPRPHCPVTARAAGRPPPPAFSGAARSEPAGDRRRLRGPRLSTGRRFRGVGRGPAGCARARGLRSRPQPLARERQRDSAPDASPSPPPRAAEPPAWECDSAPRGPRRAPAAVSMALQGRRARRGPSRGGAPSLLLPGVRARSPSLEFS